MIPQIMKKKDGECWLSDSRPSVLPAVQIVTEMSSMNESIKNTKLGREFGNEMRPSSF